MFYIITIFFAFSFGGLLGDLADLCAYHWHGEKDYTRGVWARSFRDLIPFPLFLKSFGDSPFAYQEKLPLRLLALELVCGFASVATFLFYGMSFGYILLMFLTFTFSVCLISDLRWREIPNEMNLILAGAAIFFAVIGITSWTDLFIGIVPALLFILSGIILFLIHPGQGFGIGGGDLKFLLTIGMLMGMPFVLLIACVGGLSTLLIYGATFIADIPNGYQTPVPMMVGFSVAFILLMLVHYLSLPEFDILLPIFLAF